MTTIDELPELDLLSEEFLADPIATLGKARENSWAARTHRGVEVLSYEGVTAVLRSNDFHTGIPKMMEAMGIDPKEMAGPGNTMTLSEDDQHSRLRGVVSAWFTPRRVALMRDDVVDLVEGLVAPLTANGGGDFTHAVAKGIPGPVFCWMIGAPVDRAEELYALSQVMLRAFEGDIDLAEAIRSSGEQMSAFVDELMAMKRDAPDDDLMTIMLEAADAGIVTHDDVHSMAYELLTASTDNTATTAGLIVSRMAAHPDQWMAVRADHGLIPGAIEETLRIEPRVHELSQFAITDTAILDLEIPAETFVWANIRAAQYDPGAFDDPDRFDIARERRRPQLNFGLGPHHCLGANLVRMELGATLEVLARRWSTIKPAGEAGIDRSSGGTNLSSLPISVTAA
jgi:cytochrome P450